VRLGAEAPSLMTLKVMVKTVEFPELLNACGCLLFGMSNVDCVVSSYGGRKWANAKPLVIVSGL